MKLNKYYKICVHEQVIDMVNCKWDIDKLCKTLKYVP
jgi:hypothetical protein